MLGSTAQAAVYNYKDGTGGTIDIGVDNSVSLADEIVIGVNSGVVKICVTNSAGSTLTTLSGDTSGTSLANNHNVFGGAGNDEIYILMSADSSVTRCSVTLAGGITTSGSGDMDLLGGDGADRLAGGDFASRVEGEAGDDRVTVRFPTTAVGGTGDDEVCTTTGTSTNESLLGDDGADCFEQTTNHASGGILECGGGALGDGDTDLFDTSYSSEDFCDTAAPESDVGVDNRTDCNCYTALGG
jgi:hypothetical protein